MKPKVFILYNFEMVIVTIAFFQVLLENALFYGLKQYLKAYGEIVITIVDWPNTQIL